jgi:hypothetical protein
MTSPQLWARWIALPQISALGLLEEKEKTPGWLGRLARAKDVEGIATLGRLLNREAGE